jgi:hypothetical protein
MSRAATATTPGKVAERGAAATAGRWSVGDIEPEIAELHATIGIMGHLILSPNPVEAGEWHQIEDRLAAAADRIKETWRRAWDEYHAQREAHAAEIAAAKAEHAAPGSVADLERARAYWSMLRIIAKQATQACQTAEAAVGKPRHRATHSKPRGARMAALAPRRKPKPKRS